MSSSPSSPILVVGATGQQGGAVLRALQALPTPPKLRALSRNPDSPAALKLKEQGIEVVKGSLNDVASLTAALQGAQSAFLVTTLPGKNEVAEDKQGFNFIEAAKTVSPSPFIVFSSVSDATPTCGVPHFETKAKVEEALKASGLRHTILAPVAFADNFPRSSGFGTFMAMGLFDAALMGKKIQLVATSDIGHFAALAFSSPSAFANRHIKLAGDSLTIEELRQTYARVENKSVWRAHLPSAVINLLPYDFKQMMLMFRAKGYTADIEAVRKEHPGMKTFEAWLREGRKDE